MRRKKKKTTKKKKYWIPKVKKGALKKQLGYKEDETIPVSILNKIAKAKVGTKVRVKGKTVTVTATLKKRAVLAKTFRKISKRRKKSKKKKR